MTLLKQDTLGRVELLDVAGVRLVRRVAVGSRVPLSRLVARILLSRERRALLALGGVTGVPRLVEGTVRGGELTRTYVDGAPLYAAMQLPSDYFDLLERLVRALHARGVCHNDLHKEPNILVGPDGRPGIVDFQLASVHPHRSGALFRSRVRDDLRHVFKHRARYERATGRAERSGRPEVRRGVVSKAWRALAKPVYNLVSRRLLRCRDDEPRRPRSGPWPVWTDPVGEGTD